jgi:aldehyde:ferredoxin oxidoreductase
MMVTAQGADHTAGNLPAFKSKDKPVDDLVEASLDIQELCAAADSLGLCIFGRSVTNENLDMIVEALNDAHDANLTPDFYRQLGREALVMEWQFNKDAGFTEEDDELPEFFFTDALAPTGAVARYRSAEVNASFRKLLEA